MNFKSLSLLSMLGIAAGFLIATFVPPMAAHADPVVTASTATDAAWQLVAQYGWLWGGMLLLLGLGQALLRANESKHWIAQGRTLALLSGGLAVLGSIAQWHFGGGPLEGALVTLVTALTLVWHPTVPAAPVAAMPAGPGPTVAESVAAGVIRVRPDGSITGVPPKPPTSSGTAAMLAVLLLGGLAMSQTGCATLRPRAAAGAGAFIDCEAAHLDGKLLADAIALAKSAVQHWIGGDGHVDVGGIKADAAPIKSDLGRCAFAAAIAAATAPAPTSAGAPASAPLEVDAAGLRVAFAEIKASWGVAAVQTSAGVQ